MYSGWAFIQSGVNPNLGSPGLNGPICSLGRSRSARRRGRGLVRPRSNAFEGSGGGRGRRSSSGGGGRGTASQPGQLDDAIDHGAATGRCDPADRPRAAAGRVVSTSVPGRVTIEASFTGTRSYIRVGVDGSPHGGAAHHVTRRRRRVRGGGWPSIERGDGRSVRTVDDLHGLSDPGRPRAAGSTAGRAGARGLLRELGVAGSRARRRSDEYCSPRHRSRGLGATVPVTAVRRSRTGPLDRRVQCAWGRKPSAGRHSIAVHRNGFSACSTRAAAPRE